MSYAIVNHGFLFSVNCIAGLWPVPCNFSVEKYRRQNDLHGWVDAICVSRPQPSFLSSMRLPLLIYTPWNRLRGAFVDSMTKYWYLNLLLNDLRDVFVYSHWTVSCPLCSRHPQAPLVAKFWTAPPVHNSPFLFRERSAGERGMGLLLNVWIIPLSL